ncbi:substrate-binding domain-containing protein [Psychromonas sp.]|uniref:substrate-binding domain-containing protein n=1 Tax=Psychromonas sp. TaxID=1884585 RepID=UPI00356525D4
MFRSTSWRDIPTILILVLSTSLYSQKLLAAEEYITIDRYVRQHPEQKTVMADFAKIVTAAAAPTATLLEEPVRIAVIYPSIQAADYWRRSLLSFERRLTALHIPYELNFFASRPAVDSELQSRQLADALQWQPDYLIFTLDIAPHSRMIDRMLSQGRPKIILQNITTPLKQWQTGRPFMYAGFDHVQGTKQLAQSMLEQINHRGKYLLLYHSQGYVSRMRGDTFAEEAAKYPGITQVSAYYTDNNIEKAYQATLQTLQQHPDLKMIYACSTDIALGALQALRETDRLDILINGWGGGEAELQALQQQELDITVMRSNDDNGIAMAEAIKLDQYMQTDHVPHIFAGEIKLLDKKLSLAEINRLKKHAFRLSGLPAESN